MAAEKFFRASGEVWSAAGAILTVKRAFANIAAATTDGAIVAAVASKKIRVLYLREQCGAVATTIVYNSKPAGAGTAISSTHLNQANEKTIEESDHGLFETVSGEGLSATTGAGATTSVDVLYIET
ncbi:MAG: hypothetical protein A3E78_09165 [Alphaproteobacteria bacterium RIFCSPHIGHO2_12_FULL_63_12]|nr:MAG: hypothetical protein A3E78_09165 [Alphaproteobacteria bacterium RIFCSPHIGHO2_12_FULL_63_12]